MKSLLLFIITMTLAIALPAFGGNEELFRDIEVLAKKGNPEAQYHLGMFYNNGIGVAQNTKAAYEWFQKSAAGSDPLGNYKLGCYYNGQGKGVVAIDHQKALQYKLIAAKQGYALAQVDVASIFFQDGNQNEALHWLKLAAAQGDFDALYALFNLYYQGKYIEKNIYEAYLNLNLAAKAANSPIPPSIQTIIDKLSSDIPLSDKNKADKIIFDWKPNPSQLTVKALSGLREARAYANKQKGSASHLIHTPSN